MSYISLEDYAIYLEREGTLSSLADCPPQLKDLFTLIISVQSLEWDFFGGTIGGDRSIQSTPVMQYETELKSEAEILAAGCLDFKREDDIETRWVEVQQPIVFYRFDREQEEVYRRDRHHHCFICGKHFPLRSRPLLNFRSGRSFEHKISRVHGDDRDSEDADVCKVHLNVSNFDIAKLTYPGYEDEKKKIPDLTVGLLAWSENAWSAPPTMNESEMDKIIAHDLVRPFRLDVLDSLENAGLLKPLFTFPKSKKGVHVNRMRKSPITFPFLIWEAKKASEGDPVAQNALKVKMILEWQRDLAERAKIAWKPLVFHLVSMGSKWTVYACHIQPSKKKTGNIYPFRLLWTGDCANQTKALQLLYLIDIIALWGQFQYKPFAGACIRILKRRSKGGRLRRLLQTNLLEHQKSINGRNFRSIQYSGIPTIGSKTSSFKLQRAGTDTPEAEINKQLMLGMRFLSLETYYIPERDGFIWLLHHREYRGADLLVVRVNTGGSVLPPLVIFSSSDWISEDFRYIIREERARMPHNIATDFRYDKDYSSVWQKCFDARDGQCTLSDIQFCAILPLKHKRGMIDNTCAHTYFQPLEKLLGLQALVDAAQHANELWCICQEGPESERGDLILCDATNCTVGWYHKECVGLDEDYSGHDWICPTCKESRHNISWSKYDNGDFEDGILEASDERIQRARSLNRAWNNHRWPEPGQVRHLMYRKICCEIEMETNPHKFRNTVDCLEAERYSSATRHWAIIKNDPLRFTQIRQRFRAAGED
ncbi:Nn.00g027100.m01.CDS01 [Neocucurbitaria sp. VM-36]